MNIFKFTQGIFDSYYQCKDMAGFHNLQGKLEPVTLKHFSKQANDRGRRLRDFFCHFQSALKTIKRTSWCADYCNENNDVHCFGQSESFACVKEYRKEPEEQ